MLPLWVLIPRSEAIRTTAITPWSLLPSRCSWWYCSLGNDYPAIKTNVGFIGAEILGRYCVAIRHTICSTSLKSKHLWQEVIRLNEPNRTWCSRHMNLDWLCMSEWVKGDVFKLTIAVFMQMWTQYLLFSSNWTHSVWDLYLVLNSCICFSNY